MKNVMSKMSIKGKILSSFMGNFEGLFQPYKKKSSYPLGK